ncbi:MAG: helix-turn-helix domain-containing protein [Thermoplasmata archaeon]|nr:helix-turn-helix domain-containing protein [Thermoplasmata archaeon]
MEIEELAGMDMGTLLERYKKVRDDLALLDFSEYETRAYIALVALQVSDAETIAMTAQVPRTSMYKVLESLAKKGYVSVTEGRPRQFSAEPPLMIKEKLLSRLGGTFDDLESIHGILREKGMPQVIYTVTGKERVLNKMAEFLGMAKHRVMLSTSNASILMESLDKKFLDARNRGVEISVITLPGQKFISGVKVIRRPGLIATDMVVDGHNALIAGASLEVCGFTDNAVLAQHLEGFLTMMHQT